MPDSLDVTPYPIPDREALADAFFQLNDQGWGGYISYRSRGVNQPKEYYCFLEKGTRTAEVQVGDQLVSIGGGVLMLQSEYDELFGGGS